MRFRPRFEPRPGEQLVSKSVNSAFIGTDLDLRLKRLGAKHVVTFGIGNGHVCVDDGPDGRQHGLGHDPGARRPATASTCRDGQGGTVPAEQVQRAHVATLAFEFCRTAWTVELTLAEGCGLGPRFRPKLPILGAPSR
jgi:hypothetical protein